MVGRRMFLPTPRRARGRGRKSGKLSDAVPQEQEEWGTKAHLSPRVLGRRRMLVPGLSRYDEGVWEEKAHV